MLTSTRRASLCVAAWLVAALGHYGMARQGSLALEGFGLSVGFILAPIIPLSWDLSFLKSRKQFARATAAIPVSVSIALAIGLFVNLLWNRLASHSFMSALLFGAASGIVFYVVYAILLSVLKANDSDD